MNPTLPEDELAILKQQHLQGVQQQKASPQFLANRTFRQRAVRRSPVRAHERDGSVAEAARSREDRRVSRRALPAEQRVPAGGRRCRSRPRRSPRSRRRSAAGRGAMSPKPSFPAPPALTRPARRISSSGPTASSRRSALGNVAIKRSDPRWYELTLAQHGLRRRVQLAHRAEHPRREGLHLFAAVGADRLCRRRLLSIRGRRAQRGDRARR